MNALRAGAALFLSAVLHSSSFSVEPVVPLHQLQIDHWSVDQGLPHNSVSALLQTRDGFLWIGTLRGLARFDGEQFRPVAAVAAHSNRIRDITSLAESPDGSIWIGTEGAGLLRYHHDSLTVYSTSNDLPGGSIGSLSIDSSGYVWARTMTNAVVALAPPYTPGTFRVYTRANGLPEGAFNDLAAAPDGSMWVACARGGVSIIEHGVVRRPSLDATAMGEAVFSLGVDPRGRMLVSAARGVFVVDSGRLALLLPPRSQRADYFTTLCVDRDKQLWAGSFLSGLYRRPVDANGGAPDRLTSADGLAGNYIGCLLLDRDGSLWVGTEDGLNRLREGSVTTISEREGFAHETALTLCEDADGDVWAGTDGGGVYRIGLLRAATRLQQLSTLADAYVHTIVPGEDGAVLVGTSRGDITAVRGNRARTTFSGKRGAGIRAIFRSRDRSLWIGTDRGLQHRSPDAKTPLATPLDTLSCAATAFLEDRAGTLWIGTEAGLHAIHAGVVTHIPPAPGLPPDEVMSLSEDSTGSVWVGTSSGLIRVYGDTVQRFGIAEGLPDGLITCTLEDGLGYLWMGTARGIARIARSDFDLVATGARTRLRALTFATADGMRTAECAQRGQSAGIRTRRGELWFATTRGIAIVNPRRLRLRVAMHPVIVEEIFTDQRRRKAADAPVVLSPGEADFRVAYTLPAFIAPSRLRFRYRLEGFDREWIDAGGRRVAYYTNVPPGSYTFQVAAQYADDESTVSMASLPLVLAPHFYQRTAFFIAIGFLAVLAVVASHWVRERRAEARGRALEDVIEERTRDLREEIEERTRVEAALRESEQHQLAILRVMPVVLYGARTPSEYDSTWISENVERVTGFPPERFTTEPRFWSSRIHPRDLGAAQAQLSALRNGLATDMEYRWQCADGTYRWFLDHVVSVQRAEEGEAVNYFGIWFDITDRREAEDKLRMSLREKESLLKEIHHRVKNNLTVITSLLSLQSAATKDRASAEVLREAENRVRSMAAIHQQLYESTNLSAIDFHAYADRLLAHLFRTYSRDGITYTLEVYDAFFEVATAIPCGLIINELVTNALKYAFVGRSTGKVVVGVTIAAGEVRLRVADDGVGFVPPGSFDEVPTLGLQLVNLLAEQMRGTARITSGNGTQWDIVFPQPRAT